MFDWINNVIINVVEALGVYGPILACLLILIESILPFLPLFVFITLNFLAFGNILGWLISWIFTVLGCMLSFMLFRTKVRNIFDRKLRAKDEVNKLMKKIDKMRYKYLVLLMAIPFTPAFLINIAGGLSKISKRKYFLALVVGKIFLVYFWGFIGTSLVQSFKNPIILIRIGVMLLVAYLVSMLVNKRLKIDGGA